MIRINSEALRKYLDSRGEGAISALAVETGISAHTIQKMAGGYYPSSPSRLVREALMRATGLTEEALFIKAEKAS